MSNILQNKNVTISFNQEDKSIIGRDLTDHNNMPAFFTKKKRSIKKGWEELTKSFNEEMTMYGAIKILDKFNLDAHSYCRMD